MTHNDSQGQHASSAPPSDDVTPLVQEGISLNVSRSQPEGGQALNADDATLERLWEAITHLPRYLRLAAAITKDPDVPKRAKVVLGLGAGYAISPVDLVPGIIPVAGQLDDLYALLTALHQSLKRMPDEIADRHLLSSEVTRDDIEGDLQAVRDLVRKAVMKTVKYGGKTFGRLSRAAVGFANEQLKRRNTGRTEKPL